ncbi:MAG: hypothetical protein OHK0029_42720 [Armatimonadaceae bacterium]
MRRGRNADASSPADSSEEVSTDESNQIIEGDAAENESAASETDSSQNPTTDSESFPDAATSGDTTTSGNGRRRASTRRKSPLKTMNGGNSAESADGSNAEAGEPAADGETTPPESEAETPEAEVETPTRKRSSRRSSRKKTDETVEATGETEAEDAEKPKRTSRRRSPRKSEAEATDTTDTTDTPEAAEGSHEAEQEAPKRRRRSRKKEAEETPVAVEATATATETEPQAETDDVSETAAEAPEAPAEEPVDDPASEAETPDVVSAPVAESAEIESVVAEVAPEPEPVVVATSVVTERPIAGAVSPTTHYIAAEITPSGRRRVRGLRGQKAARPLLPATFFTYTGPISLESLPEDSPLRRRVRGLRRIPVQRTVVEAPPLETISVGVPAEPVPPPYQPLSAEILARLPEGKIERVKERPQLVINGEPRLPHFFFVNTEDAEGSDTAIREIRMAYESGVRFFTLLAHLPWKGRNSERRYESLDEALQLIAENAPDAFLMPRFIFSPPVSWAKNNEAEMTLYSDKETGDVSFASKAFWQDEAIWALRAAIEYIAQGGYAERVFGFYLEHGEWFYENGRGYDYSEANIAGFRAWLKNKYKNNLVLLRSAWCDGSVTFDSVTVPGAPPEGPTLFFADRETRWVDYHEYASELVAEVIERLGETVKEASGGRSLTAVSYGYTMELARAESGHLALRRLLDSAAVDVFTGPLSYTARTPGGAAPLPVPLDSIHLAGKLYVSEDDTKTYLADEETPDAYNPKIGSEAGTWAVHSRNFGAALTRNAGVSWMDLWGTGWLNDREMWNRLSELQQAADRVAQLQRSDDFPAAEAPDVAVIVDEQAFFAVRSDEELLGKLVTQQRDTLLRSGARVGFYLMSDLLRADFPDTPRLLLFLNAFSLPDEIRTVIRSRFQNEGRTLAWVFSPGAREESLSELSDVIGIQLRLQPWGSRTGTTVYSENRSPLIEFMRGQKFGDEARTNPSYYVVDSKAQILGEYANGNPSLAYRKHPRWQSVFIGEATFPQRLLRGLYRLAGVPVYTPDDDVAWVGDNLICLHSAPGGGTSIYLPEEAVVYDLLNAEVLSTGGYGARFAMPLQGTRLLFFGSPEAVRALGGDPTQGPEGLTRSELPPPPPTFQMEAVPEPEPPLTVGGPDLMAAVLAGEMPVPDKDSEEDSSATGRATTSGEDSDSDGGSGKRKRRRRRRGRGRSNEDSTNESESEEVSSDSDDSEDSDSGEENDADTAEAEPTAAIEAESDAGSNEDVGNGSAQGNAPRRPSLEELLPQSEIPDGSELPPIPEEFLPLDPEDLTGGDSENNGRRRRSRRGGRPSERSESIVESRSAEVPEAVSDAEGAESPEVGEPAETDNSADSVESAPMVEEDTALTSEGASSSDDATKAAETDDVVPPVEDAQPAEDSETTEPETEQEETAEAADKNASEEVTEEATEKTEDSKPDSTTT